MATEGPLGTGFVFALDLNLSSSFFLPSAFAAQRAPAPELFIHQPSFITSELFPPRPPPDTSDSVGMATTVYHVKMCRFIELRSTGRWEGGGRRWAEGFRLSAPVGQAAQ